MDMIYVYVNSRTSSWDDGVFRVHGPGMGVLALSVRAVAVSWVVSRVVSSVLRQSARSIFHLGYFGSATSVHWPWYPCQEHPMGHGGGDRSFHETLLYVWRTVGIDVRVLDTRRYMQIMMLLWP